MITIGADLLSVERMSRQVTKRFLDANFTRAEREEIAKVSGAAATRQAAKLFALKEATFKALKTSPDHLVSWKEIEVATQKFHAPEVTVAPGLLRRSAIEIEGISATLSYDGDFVVAAVVVERKDGSDNRRRRARKWVSWKNS